MPAERPRERPGPRQRPDRDSLDRDSPDRGAPVGERVETRRGLIGPFTGRQLAAAVAVVVGAALLLVLVTRPIATVPAGSADPRPTQFAIGPTVDGLLLGSVAPPLTIAGPDGTATALRDVDGNVVDLAALRGRPVWINFWASWCPPCQSETPTLRDVYARYRDQGLALIAISVQESTEADVRAYARKYGLGFTVAADLSPQLFHRYRVYGLPTQFFIDRAGVITAVVQGPVTPESAAANLALLGLTAPSGASPSPSLAAPSAPSP